MRTVPLTVLKGGINRQRIKGGARADTLYDLVNGHITDANTARSRYGTRRTAVLNSTTKGLVSFDGALHTFCNEVVEVPAGFTLHVLTSPENTDNPAITKIHFAAPFLGTLYVVAEFSDGGVFHFWQSSSGTWQADHTYKAGDVVDPTDSAGLQFKATRLGAPYPSWAPSVPRAVNDIVEPTEYNDFFYTVIDTAGTNPASGTTEPDWPESDGAQVTEDIEGSIPTAPTTNGGPSASTPPSDVTDRYG